MSSFSWNHMGPISKSAGNSLLFLFLMFVLMIFSGKTIARDTLTQSEKLSVEQTLISSGQLFELGFFSPGNSSKRYVGIWYRNKPLENILWVANRENPLSASDAGSALSVGTDGNLVLLDGMKRTVWTTNVSSHPNSTVAVLSDNGNLILKDNVSSLNLWEGFNHPCDTFISGMKLGTNNKTGERLFLSSWRTKDDPSLGNFTASVTTENPPQTFVWKSLKRYWRSGPWDGSRFVGTVDTDLGYANGYTVIPDLKQDSIYISYNIPSLSYIGILYIAPDGNLKGSHWDTQTRKGHDTWKSIVVPCDVYGACGPFGVCNRVGSQSCECLKGFVPKSIEEWKNENWTSGCVRRSELLCEKNIQKDGFSKLTSMKLPDQYSYFYNLDSSGCEQWCLSNCSCTAYAYSPEIRCLVWVGSLLDTQKIPDGVDLFLRLAHSELGEKGLNMKLIICLTTISGVVLLGALLFGLQRRKANKKVETGHAILKVKPSSSLLELCATPTKSSDIPMFDFNTLVVATEKFSETNKLGRGGFGLVYKGKLEDGREIAVKRLSIHSGQGVEAFKNEILLISKLQHRNLVRLLGYSIKVDEKLLIYEYMKNKSLDTLLFDSKSGVQLDWAKRFNIIEGVARGLLYLHRDSRLRIIHRDLKASNILLDENMDPKISDFGVARSFDITQELADTQHVVGTLGYISPEYAMGGLLSEKSDVYSFGVLLLEIISGMKNNSFFNDEGSNLRYYAWYLWKEGRGLELMDPMLRSSCIATEFMQCMHIGLLCIQDRTVDRPSMSTVVLLLRNEADFPQPKEPIFYQGLGSGLDSRSYSKSSKADGSI